jgi:hypothetical protein
MKKVELVLVVAVIGAMLSACAKNLVYAPYGNPVRFAKGREIVFRDFSMHFLGERRVSHPVFRPGFRYLDFAVTGRKGTQTVSWSSGTGVIDSTSFQVEGRDYELELRGSVARKGWLRDDEMVVWPESDFRAALERRNRESR